MVATAVIREEREPLYCNEQMKVWIMLVRDENVVLQQLLVNLKWCQYLAYY